MLSLSVGIFIEHPPLAPSSPSLCGFYFRSSSRSNEVPHDAVISFTARYSGLCVHRGNVVVVDDDAIFLRERHGNGDDGAGGTGCR